jgi:molecular chaperone GrpE
MMPGNAAMIRALIGRAAANQTTTTTQKGMAMTTTMTQRTIATDGRRMLMVPASNRIEDRLRLDRSGGSMMMNVRTGSLVVSERSRSSSTCNRWFSSTNNNNNNNNTEEEEAKSKEERSNAVEEETPPNEEENETNANTGPSFEEQITTLEGEVKTLRDQLLRSLAEQENTRQIAKRDVGAAKNFAIKSFAKSLLEVSDNLQRALDAVPQEALNDGDDDDNNNSNNLKTLYEGVEMTNDGLTKAFQSNGIVAYCQEPGDVFDPNKHQALMEYLDLSKEPGTVGQVIKAGFTLNDRVLRPAEVGVVKKP